MEMEMPVSSLYKHLLPIKNMKVLFISAGIPLYYSSLLNNIANEGVEIVTLISNSKESKTIGKGVKLSNEENNFKIIQSEEHTSWYGKTRLALFYKSIYTENPDIIVTSWPYFLQLFFERNIFKLIKNNNIKLMINEIPFQTPPYGKLISYYKKHPVYDENMNLLSKGILFYIKSFFVMLIRRWCYKRVDGTLNYLSDADNIISTYGVKKDSVYVTFNTIDDKNMDKSLAKIQTMPKLLTPNHQRIIHIGRLVKWKKVDLLINTFTKVLTSYPESELIIIGEGPELQNLKQLSIDLGIHNKVLFTGGIYNQDTLAQYMTESSVYVLAGMGGLSINDAMACGLPVICSECDGTEKDLVVDGENGLFFKGDSEEDLIEKIIYLFSNPDLIHKMGAASKKIIMTKINTKTVTQRYINAFNCVLKNNKNSI